MKPFNKKNWREKMGEIEVELINYQQQWDEEQLTSWQGDP